VLDLDKLRKEVDIIDEEIMSLLKKRLSITEKIISLKTKNDIPLKDAKREKDILDKIKGKESENNFIRAVYKAIFEYSYKKYSKDLKP